VFESDARRKSASREHAQPELASPEMDAWAAYQRRQADALGLEVIDTRNTPPGQVADEIQTEIERMRAERTSRRI
jgi:hypothetical protein